MSPVISGIIGAVATYLLFRWLARRFPVSQKPHPIDWYRPRYEWIEWAGLVLFVCGMGLGLWLYSSGVLARNDPRGLAVGFTVGCILPFAFLYGVCGLSRRHRLREYWDFQELKHGVKNRFAFLFVLPFFALSVYGALHFLLTRS